MSKKISSWGNYPVVNSPENSFSSLDQLDFLVQSKSSVIARGLGRSYGDSSLSDSQMVSTLKYNRLISFDSENGILEAQSGISFENILRFIVPKGWFLPVSPGTKFITLGGAIASDIHGKNHHSEGSFSSHVLEMDILQEDGIRRVCSSLNSPDLFWATCGGMGLTGIILSAKFRLKKIESSFIKKIEIRADNLDHIISLFEEYKGYTYSMAWIDCLKGGNSFGRSIMMVGEHALMEELNPQMTKTPFQLPPSPKLSIPFYFPNIALNSLTIQAFNFIYYHSHSKRKTEKIVSFDPFFYPLDSILNWNKMYGKRGFVQYQFVIPLKESRKGLYDILERIRKRKMGSFLAVLKLFGPQDGILSFPMEGYTLALDFPMQKGLFPFLDELDKVVLSYGGRIYLTKDARMDPKIFWESYPNLKVFKNSIENYNPKSFFHSKQSERLSLTHFS